MKEVKIEVPNGYEIDVENSTFEVIKFKKKPEKTNIKNWNDLCMASLSSKKVRIKGCAIDGINSTLYHISDLPANSLNRNIFYSTKQAKSARAFAMISQLMPYYGGAITDAEWEDIDIEKYIIVRRLNKIYVDSTFIYGDFLAFRTRKYRDSFLENNKELVNEFLMID